MYNDVITAISTVGFPIFACCAMGFGLYKFMIMHREEVSELRDTIEKNTEALIQLVTIIDRRGKDE